jgi:hypothetical protein
MLFRFFFVSFMAKSLQRGMFPGFAGIYDFSALSCHSASLLLRRTFAALGKFFPSSPPPPRNATTPDFCSATLRRCRHSSQLLPCQDSVFLGFV